MARHVGVLVASLMATAHAFAPNKPGCADNVASAFADVVGIAGGIVYATDNCVPNNAVAWNGLACASDILGALSNSGHAGAQLSAATFNCGNIDSSCAQQILSAIDDFSSFGSDIVGTIGECPADPATPSSGLLCAKFIVSALDNLVLTSKDIDSAVTRCALASPEIPPPIMAPNETDGGDGGDPGFDVAPPNQTDAPVPEPDLLERRRRLALLQELEQKKNKVTSRLLRLASGPLMI